MATEANQQDQEQDPNKPAAAAVEQDLDQGKVISEEEAEAQFAAGFEGQREKLAPLGEPGPAARQTDEPVDDSAAAPAAAAEPEGEVLTPEQVKQLQKRMRKMEGMFGTVNQQLAELKKAPAATSAESVEEKAQASLKHLDDIERMIGEFKELAPLKDELISIREDLVGLKGSAGKAQVDAGVQDIGRLTDQITEVVTLNVRHPDWQTVTSTEEFKQFMLSGGPEADEYDEYRKVRDAGKQDEAEAFIQGWQQDNPKWWDTRGQYLFSSKTDDSVRMLDEYKQILKQKSDAEQTQQRQQNRLRRASVRPGVSDSPVTGKTDEEAFAGAFNRTLKRRLVT